MCLMTASSRANEAAPYNSLGYTPPPMFEDAPSPQEESRPEEYAEPGIVLPDQIIEHSTLYTLRRATPAVSMNAVLSAPSARGDDEGPDVALAALRTPPKPLDRPARFAVSRAYAQSLVKAAYGRGASRAAEEVLPPVAPKPAALKLTPMTARDILKSLE